MVHLEGVKDGLDHSEGVAFQRQPWGDLLDVWGGGKASQRPREKKLLVLQRPQ